MWSTNCLQKSACCCPSPSFSCQWLPGPNIMAQLLAAELLELLEEAVPTDFLVRSPRGIGRLRLRLGWDAQFSDKTARFVVMRARLALMGVKTTP
uniref:SAM-dependent methyltransferase n=1 Tax=Globodera pallida TaxID=36090 RepID=A0A183C0B8_GLOPA